MDWRYLLKSIDGIPVWFNIHGMNMKIQGSLKEHIVSIGNNSAKIVITKSSSGYIVEWGIGHTTKTPIKEIMHARSWFGDDDLAEAFGLNREYVFSIFIGKFVRRGNFLNVSCPGSGDDGDPNISIYLTSEIKRAISRLLSL